MLRGVKSSLTIPGKLKNTLLCQYLPWEHCWNLSENNVDREESLNFKSIVLRSDTVSVNDANVVLSSFKPLIVNHQEDWREGGLQQGWIYKSEVKEANRKRNSKHSRKHLGPVGKRKNIGNRQLIEKSHIRCSMKHKIKLRIKARCDGEVQTWIRLGFLSFWYFYFVSHVFYDKHINTNCVLSEQDMGYKIKTAWESCNFYVAYVYLNLKKNWIVKEYFCTEKYPTKK